jgi:hypothetical protein
MVLNRVRCRIWGGIPRDGTQEDLDCLDRSIAYSTHDRGIERCARQLADQPLLWQRLAGNVAGGPPPAPAIEPSVLSSLCTRGYSGSTCPLEVRDSLLRRRGGPRLAELGQDCYRDGGSRD